MNESLLTAEQLISSMREQVLTLYQHVIKPSDSRASDLLEFSELIAHLKETFDTINDEVCLIIHFVIIMNTLLLLIIIVIVVVVVNNYCYCCC